MKLFMLPRFSSVDAGDGGIRRVVEAQKRYLPEYGFEIVDSVEKADIVATHGSEIAEVPPTIPWVVHCHGLYWSEYNWPAWGDYVNAHVIECMRRADHVTAPSEWVGYALKRGMWLNPSVIYHGIDPEDWKPGKNGGYVLWNKARKDAISDPEPVNRLAELCPDIKFVSTFAEPAENIKLTGKKPYAEARRYIQNAGIYLCTTRETFGIGTLEAMACGVPILGWDWGGQREIIKHKKTGWLSPVGDYEDLKKGLYWLIKNRSKVGAQARDDVLKNYLWSEVMKKYAELYKSIYEKRTAPNPKISIICPLYNISKYLSDMVKSVQEQSYTDWELVVNDDCSTDGSYEMALNMAKTDTRIQVFRNERNQKLPGNLNAGFSHARGRYIMNLDADNMLPPDALKVLVNALDGDRSLHIVYGRIKFVTEDGITPSPVTGTPDGISRWPPEFDADEQFRCHNQISCSAMWRREVFERTGGYRERATVEEDAEFWTRAISYGFRPEKVTAKTTLIYRVHPEQKSKGEKWGAFTKWFSWSGNSNLMPWASVANPPQNAKAWPVPSCEPAVITVIIPVGPGHERLVIDALDSVESQTFRDWRCIVVNDTGENLAVPHTWAEIINTAGKRGPGAARNLGISKSKTDLFVCLDADDILEPHCLDTLYRVWTQEGGIIYSQWWDDKGEPGMQIWDPPEWEPELLATRGCIFAMTALYPKSAWKAVGGFDEGMKNWEDWDFQIACALKGICATKVGLPLFTYRKNTGFRRDESMKLIARGKSEMMTKYPGLFNGHKEDLNMGCCGKKTAQPALNMKPAKPAENGVVMLEYTGGHGRSKWLGKNTRRAYYFGADASHKRAFVYQADVEGFMAMKCFRVIMPEQPAIKPEPALAGV